jgi:FAD/FMN-containing dehydrogenase
MRRESFNLLRHRIKGMKTAPFVDDVIVRPEHYPEFLPKLYEILSRYEFLYTVAGHIGDGNFHIIPLMKLENEEERKKIPAASEEIYNLVLKYGGSITAEHNDGLIRSPYLEKMYGRRVVELFRETKKIFDPLNIFNPGKKVDSSLKFALEHIKR